MASRCLCSSILNGVPVRDLSSSAAFGCSSSFCCSLPTAPYATSKLVSTKCSLSEEDQSARTVVGRRALAGGVVATGAALAMFTNIMAIAALGPGNEGPQRVAEKADDLLKSADKLNIEDAPKRFGPGQTGGDPTKISQHFYSRQKQSGTALSDAKEKADEVVSNLQQAVNQDGLGGFKGGSKEAGFNVDKAAEQARNKKVEITNSAEDAIGQAQSKTNIGSSGGNVLSSLQEGIQGLKENEAQSAEDVKSSVQTSAQ